MNHLDQTKKSQTDIVFRLRLSLCLIVLIISITGMFGGFQLLRLHNSQQQAINQSVPTLSKSLELENSLNDINDLTARLSSEYSKDKVLKLRSSLVEKSNLLKTYIDSDALLQVDNNTAPDKLEGYLDQLEKAVSEIVPLKMDILSLDKSIATKLSNVAQLRESYNAMIEPLAIDQASVLDRTLKNIDANPKLKLDSSFESLKVQINDQYELSEISLHMSILLDSVENLSPQKGEISGADVSNRMEFNLRSITQLLVNFGDIDSRQKLAKIVKKLRDLSIGTDGLLNDIFSIEKSETDFDNDHISLLTLVNEISNHIDVLVSTTKSDIESTTLEFNSILRNTVIASILFGLALLMVIAFISYFVVERQINGRMYQLTSAVIDIANGDTDRHVGISGHDEIGVMADALEVFKGNATELRRSNMELEQFAYAASHDLKSPLRAIENLAQWTLEDAGDELSLDSKNNLVQLLTRAKRLSRLQSDLLEYSRVGQVDSSIDNLDIHRMVTELSDLLDPDRNFKFKVIRSALDIDTRITPLRQIILNLVTNAIKHHDKNSGIIEVDARVEMGRLVVSVSDDGPGIAKEYHTQIFGLFEKLESQDLVEGSGLGLSLVKKLVEGSKGNISVISDPDVKRGSTFVFDWPISDNAHVGQRVVGF